jgi:hypothetical protein
MAKNPHKPFKEVVIDDGPTVLECRPEFDSTMIVRKPVPTTTLVVEPKPEVDLIAPEAVNKKDFESKIKK